MQPGESTQTQTKEPGHFIPHTSRGASTPSTLIPTEQLVARIAKHTDAFPDELPAGQPPDRNMGRTIILGPNFVRPYWLQAG